MFTREWVNICSLEVKLNYLKNYFWALKPTWAAWGLVTVQLRPLEQSWTDFGPNATWLFIVPISPTATAVYLADSNLGMHEDIKLNQEESSMQLPQCPLGNIVKKNEDDFYSAGGSLTSSVLASSLAY